MIKKIARNLYPSAYILDKIINWVKKLYILDGYTYKYSILN